jgi:hypothetical protein
MSFGKLDALIQQNQKLVIVHQFRKQPEYVPKRPEERFRPVTYLQQTTDDIIVDDLLRPVQQYDQQITNPSKKKKRKKYLGQSL